MDKNFCFGLILGMVGGGILATNIPKVRKSILSAQEKLKAKFKESQNQNPENE